MSCRDTTENPPNSRGCITTARATRSFLSPQQKGNHPIKITQHTIRYWEQRRYIPTSGESQAHTPTKRQLPQAPRTQTIFDSSYSWAPVFLLQTRGADKDTQHLNPSRRLLQCNRTSRPFQTANHRTLHFPKFSLKPEPCSERL